MSQLNPTTPRRLKSYGKLFEATTLWAIIAIVVGWLVFKEINRKTLEIEQDKAGRKVVIEARDLHGISARSPIICQGLKIGKVTAIDSVADEDDSNRLAIIIRAQLDAQYSSWKFAPDASVEQNGMIGGLTGTSIALSFTGIQTKTQIDYTSEEPQQIRLQAPEDLGDRLSALLSDAETVMSVFTEEIFPPDNWPADKAATRIDVLAANLTSASESLRAASAKLDMEMNADAENSLMAGMQNVQYELQKFTVNSNELIGDFQILLSSIETRFDDVLGASAEERASLRKKADKVLSSLDGFVDNLDDLVNRTGDTFIGRVLIRKAEEESKADPSEGDKRRGRRFGPRR